MQDMTTHTRNPKSSQKIKLKDNVQFHEFLMISVYTIYV